MLSPHPGYRQTDIVLAAEAWTWSRSTAQHRILRLEQGGLLERLEGRNKRYWPAGQGPKPGPAQVPGRFDNAIHAQ